MNDDIGNTRRFALHSSEVFGIDLEYNKYFACLHLPYVNFFSKDALKEGLYVYEDICVFLKDMGYPVVYLATDKDNPFIHKLCERMIKAECLGSDEEFKIYRKVL